MPSGRVTSAARYVIAPGASASISAAASATMSLAKTRAPSAANMRQATLPWPPAAPVMIVFLPLSRSIAPPIVNCLLRARRTCPHCAQVIARTLLGRHGAIDRQRRAGHERRVVGHQPDHGLADFLRLAHPADWLRS